MIFKEVGQNLSRSDLNDFLIKLTLNNKRLHFEMNCPIGIGKNDFLCL